MFFKYIRASFIPFSIIVSLIMVSFNRLQAQQTNLSGRIVDAETASVPFASVLLLAAADSSRVHWAVTDEEGNYDLGKVSPSIYFVQVSVIGYLPYQGEPLVVNALEAEMLLPPIMLSENVQELAEVEIRSTRPFIERKIDRTVVNVANSIVASGSMALEVLERAPGVVVDRQNNSVSLMGKQGVIIHMDGRPTNLSLEDVVRMLSSTPSDNIETIELITNPSAKYDAVGNAGIINIVMKKSSNVGTNGSITLAGGSGRFYKSNGSAQLNHRTGKVNIYGSYGGNLKDGFQEFILYRNQSDGELRNIVEQEMFINQHTLTQTAKAGLDYFVSENTTLGVVWNGSWNDYDDRIPSAITAFSRSETASPYLQTESDILNTVAFNNQAINLNLQQKFGEKGGELSADVDVARFRAAVDFDLSTSDITTENTSQTSNIITSMPLEIDILTYKLDYSLDLGTKWKAETGVKLANVETDSDLTLEEGTNGEVTVNPELSNRFQYTERVSAGYLNLSGTIGAGTEVQGGLRAEHTYSLGNSINLDQQVTRRYLNFFPSLFVSQPLNENHSLGFSYSYRIDRPNYRGLNPARWYLDPYSFGLGNPFLQPQYTNSLELKHTFQNTIHTSLGASFVDDLVLYMLEPLDESRAVRIPRNAGTSQIYNLNVSFPIEVTNNWNMQINVMGTYSAFQFDFLGTPLTNEQLSGRLNLNNSLTLGKTWTAELSGWVSSPTVNGIGEIPWLGTLNIGVQKELGPRWKAKLNIQDVLYTNRYIFRGQTPEFVQNVEILFDSRVALLSFSYSFGNQKLKRVRQRSTGAEEEMNRAQ